MGGVEDCSDLTELGCRLAWAKSGTYGRGADEDDEATWLPLWQHLDDTADVAGLLWDEWVPDNLRAQVADALPGGHDDARRLVTWVGGVHDVGKASPAFACAVPALGDALVRAGLTIGPMVVADRSRLRHEVAGAAFLARWLSRHDVDDVAAQQLSCLVAAHHGTFPSWSSVQEVRAVPHLAGDGLWATVQDALLERAAERSGVLVRLPEWRSLRLPPAMLMTMVGVLIMADWIASGEAFPLLPRHDVPDVAPPTPGPTPRARDAWEETNLGARWLPRLTPEDVAARFVDRFPWASSGPRPLQRVVTEAAQRMTAPGLMIVEAPMGGGKTEAGLMAAEVLAARTGASGCFVALPTQATSDAIFARMLRWLERLPAGATGHGVGRTVSLVHSRAALNDDARRLPRLPALSARTPESQDGRDEGRLRAALGEWTRGRKRAGLAAFVVGTIDQVLFGALRARHVALRQLALTGKVVVVDEVHSSTVYMSTFLDAALEWLGAAGTPVVLMSATLPGSRRAALYAAYEQGRRRRTGGRLGADVRTTIDRELADEVDYPAVVTTDTQGPHVDVVETDGRTATVRVLPLDDDPEALVALLEDALEDDGCAVVVRNTVRRAQETADLLERRLPGTDVTVAHAQFLAADRRAIDAALLERFGPPGPTTARPRRHVVVATQVVEQSLDVDFDLMVSDVAPVDLLLQRIGRLHRHARERPAALREARCYVTGVGWESEPPGLDPGAVAVYGAWPLLRSLAVLRPRLAGDPLHLPADIAPLVQAAYDGGDDVVPTTWADVVAAAKDRYRSAQEARRQRARDFALPSPGRNGAHLYGLSRLGVGDVDEDSPQGLACVRDGGDSIEVVVVQRDSSGVDRVPDWVPGGGEPLPLRHVEVPPATARVLATCTLRLPFTMAQGPTGDAVVRELERDRFEGWDRTPYLSGQLALVLDEQRRATVAGFDLRYDLRRGLVVRRTTAPEHVGDHWHDPPLTTRHDGTADARVEMR